MNKLNEINQFEGIQITQGTINMQHVVLRQNLPLETEKINK